MTEKYTNAIIIGAIIKPSKKPNLSQSLFGSINVVGTKKARKKKTTDTTNAQAWIGRELVNGYRATNKSR